MDRNQSKSGLEKTANATRKTGVLKGSFVIPGGSLIADTPIIVPLLVMFNEIGSYTSQLWAEGV